MSVFLYTGLVGAQTTLSVVSTYTPLPPPLASALVTVRRGHAALAARFSIMNYFGIFFNLNHTYVDIVCIRFVYI